MTQANQNQVPAYYNLTAEGIGFLNRPRTVQGKHKGSQPYFACTIQASRGDAGDKSRFDLRDVGGRAKEIFAQLLDEFPELLQKDYRKMPTVVVGFRAGDIQPSSFESTRKGVDGEFEKIRTETIDGRLLKFKFIKVNGEYWYTEKSDPKLNQNTQENSSDENQEKESPMVADTVAA